MPGKVAKSSNAPGCADAAQRFVTWAFPIILIGSCIETGTGSIQAFNKRLAGGLRTIGRALSRFATYSPELAPGARYVTPRLSNRNTNRSTC